VKPAPKPIACAGAIVFDSAGRLLVVRRAHAPAAGHWTVPGGRCEPGESAEAACVREVAEETGLAVRVLRPAGQVVRDGPAGTVYDIADFVCVVTGSDAVRAGDDATEARWVTRRELTALALPPLLYETLAEWDCLPRS
jgi:8-oxo-dGTP diphosphatase